MEHLLQYSGSGRWKRERKRAFLLCNQTWIKFIKDAASPFKWLATVFLNSKELVGDTAPFWFRLKITEKSLLKWEETWILFRALWLKWASQTCTQCIQGPKEGRKVLRGTENWGARVWSGRSCEGAPATQIKCVSPRDRLPSSVDMPAVHQTELEVASCHPGLAASGMQGPGGQSITEHTWFAQRRQWGGRWLGGERMARGGGGLGPGADSQAGPQASRRIHPRGVHNLSVWKGWQIGMVWPFDFAASVCIYRIGRLGLQATAFSL